MKWLLSRTVYETTIVNSTECSQKTIANSTVIKNVDERQQWTVQDVQERHSKQYRIFTKDNNEQYKKFKKDNNTCAYSALIIKYADLLSAGPLFDLISNFLGQNFLGFSDNVYKFKFVNRC